MKYVFGIVAAALLTAGAVQATTITSAAGADLYRGVTESDDAQVFSEQTSVDISTVTGGVEVDYLLGVNLMEGAYAWGRNDLAAGQSETLMTGVFDSYLVHFDPDISSGKFSISDVQIDFGTDIVALILSNSGTSKLLLDSDATFGTAARYETHKARRAENNDKLSVTGSVLTLETLTANALWIDNIRVLTVAESTLAPVPVPASLPLLLVGFGGLFAASRRRR